MEHFSKVIVLYQILALHWFGPKRTSGLGYETYFFIVLNLCFVSGLLYWIFRHQALVIFSDNALGYMVDFSKFLLMIFTYYSLFLESAIQRRVLPKVWDELEQLKRMFPSTKWALQQRAHLRTVALFITYVSWWELSYTFLFCQTPRCINFTITFWILFMLLHFKQLQILLYTNMLRFGLEVLNAELAWTIELSKGANRYGGRRSDGQIFANLNKTFEGFVRAERLLELLNQTFGYSSFIIKLIIHIYILTDTYWIVQGFIRGRVLGSLYLEACLSSKFICLMLNLHSNERILSECHRTRVLLHCVHLRWQLRCEQGWQMVQHLLLKLESSQPFAMTAWSMFRLDYGTMLQIVFNVNASISLFIQISQQLYC